MVKWIIFLSNVKIKCKGSLFDTVDISILLICFRHGLTKSKAFLPVTASERLL